MMYLGGEMSFEVVYLYVGFFFGFESTLLARQVQQERAQMGVQ